MVVQGKMRHRRCHLRDLRDNGGEVTPKASLDLREGTYSFVSLVLIDCLTNHVFSVCPICDELIEESSEKIIKAGAAWHLSCFRRIEAQAKAAKEAKKAGKAAGGKKKKKVCLRVYFVFVFVV